MTTPHKLGWLGDLPSKLTANRPWNPGLLRFVPPSMLNPSEFRIGMTEVRNQVVSDCLLKAFCNGCMEYCQKRQLIDKTQLIRLSTRFGYWVARELCGMHATDIGSYPSFGLRACFEYGIPWEGYCPDDACMVMQRPTQEAFDTPNRVYIDKFYSVGNDLNTVLRCLSKRIPVMVPFTVFQKFYVSGPDARGFMPMPEPNEPYVGGHAVCACGQDYRKRAILCRNSWDENWGPLGGYFYMPFEFFENQAFVGECWAIESIRFGNDNIKIV